MNGLIPRHGGYRRLKSFQMSRLIYDITIRFCDRFIKSSRTHDQMVQAARSGVQNIAEGSQASGTSKQTEIKLTSVARSSLEELALDYEDVIRQSKLQIWEFQDARRNQLLDLKCQTADEFAIWVKNQNGNNLETAANGVLVLINVACYLLDKQLDALAKAFQNEGGFTEKLYKTRINKRRD